MSSNDDGCAGCVTAIIIWVISGFVGGFAWPYVIESWWPLFFDQQASISFLEGCLIGLVPGIGSSGFFFAIFTWLLFAFV